MSKRTTDELLVISREIIELLNEKGLDYLDGKIVCRVANDYFQWISTRDGLVEMKKGVE